MDDLRPGDRGARFLLLAACLIVVIAGMKAAAGLLLPFLIALFLAMITLPLLRWLEGKGIPTSLAVLATIAAALLVVGSVAFVVGGSLRDFTAQAPKYKERLELISNGLLNSIQARGINVSDPLGQVVTDMFDPSRAVDLVVGTLRGVAGVLSNLLMVLLTIVFILAEAGSFPAKLRAAFGRRAGHERFANIQREVQRYLGIKTLTSLTTGGSVAIASMLFGVDFPLLWGMLAFLLNYIPTLGSILAAIPPVLLAIVQLGGARALALVVVLIVINFTLSNFIEPYFMGRRLGLSTLVVFVSMVFWGWVWGPIGMLLSVPLTMIVKIMLENTEDLKWIAIFLGSAPGHRQRAGK